MVAIGAAIQGGIATGEVKDILVLDATPLSLGVETLGGVMTVADPAQHHDPDQQEGSLLHRRRQSERGDDQRPAGRARVRQGQPPARARSISKAFPPAPRGVPQIEVTFNVDVNGILTVQAKDLGTGKENKITVQNAGGLSKEEIEKMKREAESHAAEDKKRREVIDLKNQGESLAYQTEKSLKDYGDKVSGDVRGQIESALNNLRDALKSDDGDRIKKAMENLNTVSHKLAEEMYKSAATAAGAPAPVAPSPGSDRATAGAGAGAAGDGKKEDDVIDAEYEVKE